MPWIRNNSVERIGKLERSQEHKLAEFRDKWSRIATSTEPYDPDEVIDGLQRFTAEFGFTKELSFYSVESPSLGWYHGGARYPEDFGNGNYFDLERLKRSDWGTRCFLIRDFTPELVRFVENSLRVVEPLAFVHFQRPRNYEKGEDFRYLWYSQSDSSWLAVADFFATVFNNPHCQRLSGLMQAVSSSGIIWLTPSKFYFCDRPKTAEYDDHGRPHCDDGPAIEYRDGFKYYALHGIPVPEKYIDTPADQIDFADIIKEENAAVRMAVIHKFGFRRLVDSAKHRVISKAGGNSLLEFRIAAAGERTSRNRDLRFRSLHLRWRDKTGDKETVLPVPRLAREFGADRPENVSDCEAIRRWTLGWPKEALAVAET